GRVGEAEEPGELLHHERLNVGLELGDRGVADRDDDDPKHDDDEEPELAPVAGQYDDEPDRQGRKAAADDDEAQEARLGPPALMGREPGLELTLVEAAEGEEFRPRRGVGGGVHGHGRADSLRLRSLPSNSTAAGRMAGRSGGGARRWPSLGMGWVARIVAP